MPRRKKEDIIVKNAEEETEEIPKTVIKTSRKKKTSSTDTEIKEKLKYFGLSVDKIPSALQENEPLNYRIPKEYDEKQYKQYRYIPVSKIHILLSPTNRLDELSEKYKKARPLSDYLDSKSEENILRHTIFLNMLKQVDIDDIEKIDKEQQKLAKQIPFKVRYEGNYLWQIYYIEATDQYFMLVPTGDSNYSAFFYLLKKKMEKNKKNSIFAPVCGVGYSRKYLRPSEFKDIGTYLELFTKKWPAIYEVNNKNEELAIHIVGETCVYEKIKSIYHIVLENEIEASHFYKLLKAIFILQTNLPNYFSFTTDVDQYGNLMLFYKEHKITYGNMASFIKKQYAEGEKLKIETQDRTIRCQERLEQLKRISSMQDIEYLEKEKQISTFLECKKTFFGKVKYYFKYSKKSKKNMRKQTEEIKTDVDNEDSEYDIEYSEKQYKNQKNVEKSYKYDEDTEEKNIATKRNYTIEELIENYKELQEKEDKLKNVIMDINAIKLKNKNMAKKIENATNFIEEIDNHKRSIFEFWKYSNKDEISVLPEGEEEEIGVIKKIEKVFDFEEDFPEFGRNLDRVQRKVLSKEDTDSIYIATTDVLPLLDKLKTNTVLPKDVENTLKSLKKEQREKGLVEDDENSQDFDIFGGAIEDGRKVKKIGNQKHRENAKNKFEILDINKMTKQIGFKMTLETITNVIKKSFEKVKNPQDVVIYKAIVDDKIDENQFNVFDINSENEVKEACKKDGEEVNLYRINLKQGDNILGFSNIIYYDNQNKTLPLGMDFSSKVMIDMSKLELNMRKAKKFNVASFEDENDDFSNIVIRSVVVYEEI